MVGEALSDPQLPAQMDRHLGLPRDLRTSSGQGLCIVSLSLSLAFSFPWDQLNVRGEGVGRVFHTAEGTTPDRLTLSHVLPHLDEAEQNDEGQSQ